MTQDSKWICNTNMISSFKIVVYAFAWANVYLFFVYKMWVWKYISQFINALDMWWL